MEIFMKNMKKLDKLEMAHLVLYFLFEEKMIINTTQ